MLCLFIITLLFLSGFGRELKGQDVSIHENRFLLSPYNCRKINNSALYQGNRKKKKYFEGWYFKLIGDKGKQKISIIPGISFGKNGTAHAFIQVIDGNSGKTSYNSFPADSFFYSKHRFEIRIGQNYFSDDSLQLALPYMNDTLRGTVYFHDTSELPGRFLQPTIMGWYRYVPFMECYHGVVSINHSLSGILNLRDEEHNFAGGRGYIEKDWGKSMPESWIWMHCNGFEEASVSFMVSVARIPWLGNSFTGFLGFFSTGSKIHRFATYTGAMLKEVSVENEKVKLVIEDKKHLYQIEATRESFGILAAPEMGEMDRRIAEGLDAKVDLEIFDKKQNKIIYKGKGVNAGLEIVGNTNLLTPENQ